MKRIYRNRCGALVLATVLTTTTLASVPALAFEPMQMLDNKVVLTTEYLSVELEEGITLEEYARLQLLSLTEEQVAGLLFVTEFVMDMPVELGMLDLTLCKGLGTFSFADAAFIPEKGITTCEVVFTPEDADAFKYENMMGWNTETKTVHRYVQVYCTSLMTEEELLAKAEKDAVKEAENVVEETITFENETVNEQGILEDFIILAPGITVNPDAPLPEDGMQEDLVVPDGAVIPEATDKMEETVVPEVTVTPEAGEQPGEDVVPETTIIPEATDKMEEVTVPEVTVIPEATDKMEEVVTPEVTVAPETQKQPEETVVPEVTMIPEETEQKEETAVPEAVVPESTEGVSEDVKVENNLISDQEVISSPFNVAGSNVLVGGSDKTPVTPTPTPTATPTPTPTTTVAPKATPTPTPTASANKNNSSTNKNNGSSANKNNNKTTAAKTGDEANKSRFLMLGMGAFAMMTAASTALVRRRKPENE